MNAVRDRLMLSEFNKLNYGSKYIYTYYIDYNLYKSLLEFIRLQNCYALEIIMRFNR